LKIDVSKYLQLQKFRGTHEVLATEPNKVDGQSTFVPCRNITPNLILLWVNIKHIIGTFTSWMQHQHDSFEKWMARSSPASRVLGTDEGLAAETNKVDKKPILSRAGIDNRNLLCCGL